MRSTVIAPDPEEKRRSEGVSIRIFLVDGTPDGLRIVEKSNRTVLALMCARAEYSTVRTREEFDHAGVYLLTGPGDANSFQEKIYIGEADEARSRLDNQVRAKDFWTHIILFTSKDLNLNKAHVQYLESRLIALAKKAKRSEVVNSNESQCSSLSEADRADTEAYLADVLLICPLLGVTAFEIPNALKRHSLTSGGRARLFLKGKAVQASGYDTTEGFVVQKGSSAKGKAVPSLPGYIVDLRRALIQQEVLKRQGACYRFTQDYLFKSSSTAAGVVLAHNTAGPVAWRDQRGLTLRVLQLKGLGKVSSPKPTPANVDLTS